MWKKIASQQTQGIERALIQCYFKSWHTFSNHDVLLKLFLSTVLTVLNLDDSSQKIPEREFIFSVKLQTGGQQF